MSWNEWGGKSAVSSKVVVELLGNRRRLMDPGLRVRDTKASKKLLVINVKDNLKRGTQPIRNVAGGKSFSHRY